MVELAIVWEDEAKSQLKQLYYYVKRDSLQNAVSVRNAIIEKVKKAAIYPESFSPDKYKTNNDGSYRAFELDHYRVSYRVTPKEIIILRIRHTSQSPLQF